MKGIYTFFVGTKLFQNWNRFDNETQELIIYSILAVIFLLFFYFIIIPIIKFTYKFNFDLEYNKNVKNNVNEFIFSFKPQTIKDYLFGNLEKDKRNSLIIRWIIVIATLVIFVQVFSFFTIWIFRTRYYFLEFFLYNTLIYFAVPALIIGFLVSVLRRKNIYFKYSKYKNKNKFNDGVEGRLLKLKDLLDRGVINRQEYERQREKIINDL